MSELVVCMKQYREETAAEALAINEKEIWRYAGYFRGPSDDEAQLKALLPEVIEEARRVLTYKVCYLRGPLKWESDGSAEKMLLPFATDSANLATCLCGSNEYVMFAATVGLELDRLIARYQRISPTKALLLQAYGAERVEALCDLFCEEIKREACAGGKAVTPRFSPGYGDLKLEVQRDFMRLLDCNRKIGISLGDTLLMTPSKSVTAIFGIKDASTADEGSCEEAKTCDNCEKTDCYARK